MSSGADFNKVLTRVLPSSGATHACHLKASASREPLSGQLVATINCLAALIRSSSFLQISNRQEMRSVEVFGVVD